MDYDVVTASGSSAEVAIRKLKAEIKEREQWEPQGSVAATAIKLPGSDSILYSLFQAMVRKDERE